MTRFIKSSEVDGRQYHGGSTSIETERGPMVVNDGDWILSTTTGPWQEWPVTQEYLDANYTVVDEDD